MNGTGRVTDDLIRPACYRISTLICSLNSTSGLNDIPHDLGYASCRLGFSLVIQLFSSKKGFVHEDDSNTGQPRLSALDFEERLFRRRQRRKHVGGDILEACRKVDVRRNARGGGKKHKKSSLFHINSYDHEYLVCFFLEAVRILDSTAYVMLGKLFANSNPAIRFPGSHTLSFLLEQS